MSTLTVSVARLKSVALGSLAAHEQLQAAVLTYLKLCGVPARPIHTGPRVRPRAGGGFDLKRNTEQHGVFDIMGCLPPLGKLLLIDLKTGHAKLSRAQRVVHEEYTAAGALCLVVRDVRDLASHMPISASARIRPQGGNYR